MTTDNNGLAFDSVPPPPSSSLLLEPRVVQDGVARLYLPPAARAQQQLMRNLTSSSSMRSTIMEPGKISAILEIEQLFNRYDENSRLSLLDNNAVAMCVPPELATSLRRGSSSSSSSSWFHTDSFDSYSTMPHIRYASFIDRELRDDDLLGKIINTTTTTTNRRLSLGVTGDADQTEQQQSASPSWNALILLAKDGSIQLSFFQHQKTLSSPKLVPTQQQQRVAVATVIFQKKCSVMTIVVPSSTTTTTTTTQEEQTHDSSLKTFSQLPVSEAAKHLGEWVNNNNSVSTASHQTDSKIIGSWFLRSICALHAASCGQHSSDALTRLIGSAMT